MSIKFPFLLAITFGVTLLCTTLVTRAETRVFDSGTLQNQLIELYTSEGCSSCPPADRWLSSLKSEPALWRDLVPVAFHVDYWDRLGWKDRFASRAYSQRQRSYARAYQEPTVYTPGVRRNGAEWRGWRGWDGAELSAAPDVGVLRLAVDDDLNYTARFLPSGARKGIGYRLNLALLGMDLSSQIERGENRGKILRHDFVVLAKKTIADPKVEVGQDASVAFHWSGQFPRASTAAPRYAVAAWVTHVTPEGDNLGTYLDAIQATGGYLGD